MNWSEGTRARFAAVEDADANALKSWHKVSDIMAGLELGISLRNDAENLCVLRDTARRVYWRLYSYPSLSTDDLDLLNQLDDAIAALDKRHD